VFLVGRGGGKRSAFDDGWCVRLGEWHRRFLHTLTVAELERLEHWLDGHLYDTEEREVAKWRESIVQTYVDRTGDSPPNSTMGESS